MDWKKFFRRNKKEIKQKSAPLFERGGYALSIFRKRTTPPKNEMGIRKFSKHPTVRRCVNIIKDDLLKRKFEITSHCGNKRIGELQKKIAKQILDRPNNDDTYNSFFSRILEDYVIGDCGVAEIGYSSSPMRPVFLWPTNGFTVQPVIGDDVIKFAQASGISSSYKYFTAEEMYMIRKNISTDTPHGMSAIETAWEYINALLGTFEYSADMASNALPKYMALIKGVPPDKITEFAGIFEREYMGRACLPMIGAEGLEVKQIAPISNEALYTEYQEFISGIIAGAFGIPAEKIMSAKSNDRSTIDEINANLQEDCLKPYARPVEDFINYVFYLAGLDVEFSYVWEDTLSQKKIKADIVRGDWQGDILTLNEVRALRGYPSLPSKYGDCTITLMKAQINEEYGINGFGDAKSNKKEGGDKA